MEHTNRPAANIRRFDVFAEWNRLKARERLHWKEADARAYGIAVAKVVAARKFAGYQPAQVKEWKQRARHEEPRDSDERWWEHLGTAEEFERKIIYRMGGDFYTRVFQPALRKAWDEDKSYEQIRDLIRKDWNDALLPSAAPTAENTRAS